MIKMAICDDDFEFCKSLEKNIIEILNEINLVCQMEIFQNGNKLNKMILDGEYFDILLLDIELDEIKGMNIGETIRDNIKNENIYIVYISSKSYYAMDLFKTRPLDFLIKPVEYQKLKEVLVTFKELYFRGHTYFEYQYKKQYYKITYDEILYFESNDKKIVIHLNNGKKEFYGKLKDVEEMTQNYFILIHKSYLVNISKIIKSTYEYVILENNIRLNVSQSKRQEVRKKFFEMKMNKEGVFHE